MRLLTQPKLIIIVSIWLTFFYNYTFFQNLIKVYPINVANIGFLLSICAILIALTTFVLTLFSSRWSTKPLLIIIVIISSLTAYFMDTYHVIIDANMIRNTMQTNLKESMDLIAFKQIIYLIILGIFPAYLIYQIPIHYRSLKKEIISKILTALLTLGIITVLLFSFSKYYTSFFREHRPLRYSVNPLYWIYSTGEYLYKTFHTGKITLHPIGLDATIPNESIRKKLVIMVVGEAARADHFSLNGYKRLTNPMLQKEHIINYSQMYSCGTSTAVSVPCMFSIYTRENYSYTKGLSTQNVLDVLNHTHKVAILWRDNNSDSKGVALRIAYEDYKHPNNNTICVEGECRDIGMLEGLDNYIQKHSDKDIFIILHQMGNHGPAYHKRYPKAFEKFTPTCKTNQLETCTQEEIINAYDNALVYSDMFLAKTIAFLKKYDNHYDTAMLYIADHGESLGEKGLYLHGMPYFIAPPAQTHVGAFIWFGTHMRQNIDIDSILKNHNKKYSQDNIFHTLLGLFQVSTRVYNPTMDILHDK